MAGQFCDIRQFAIASARHEKEANSALEHGGGAENTPPRTAADCDVSLCTAIAKAAFCHNREWQKHGFLTVSAGAQKSKSKNEVRLPAVMVKIAQIPINRAYSYHGPFG
jgi:hypothetical protein